MYAEMDISMISSSDVEVLVRQIMNNGAKCLPIMNEDSMPVFGYGMSEYIMKDQERYYLLRQEEMDVFLFIYDTINKIICIYVCVS